MKKQSHVHHIKRLSQQGYTRHTTVITKNKDGEMVKTVYPRPLHPVKKVMT